MDILIAIFYLLSGFAVLVLGGESLVKSAISIAGRLKVSPTIVGLTVIAAGTSAPELVTSILAAINETPDIAVGNVVGSNIFNILAIIGIASIIKINRVDKSLVRFEIPALIVFTILFFVFAYDRVFSTTEGYSLLLIFVLFTYLMIQRALKNKDHHFNDDVVILKNYYYDIFHLFIGMGALVIGAHLALKGGIDLGHIAGLSERIIGITIISIGTGLPELVTSAVAAHKGQDDIAISNIIGSNIMNTLLVVGATAGIMPLPVTEKILTFDFYWLIGSTALLLPLIIITKYKITRITGALLLGTYLTFISLLLIN